MRPCRYNTNFFKGIKGKQQKYWKNYSQKAGFWQIPRGSLIWLGLSTRTSQAQTLTWKVSCVLGDLSALTFTHPIPTDNIHSSIRGNVPDSCTVFTSTWTRRDCPCITDNLNSFLKALLFLKVWYRETPTGWCWVKHLTWSHYLIVP